MKLQLKYDSLKVRAIAMIDEFLIIDVGHGEGCNFSIEGRKFLLSVQRVNTLTHACVTEIKPENQDEILCFYYTRSDVWVEVKDRLIKESLKGRRDSRFKVI